MKPILPIPPILLSPGITMDFQVIPPVREQKASLSFLMGSRGYNSDEEPRQRVIIPRPFYLGTFPVTQGQFAVWTGSTDYAEWFAGAHEREEVDKTTPHQNSFSGSPLLPAENLSWYEAKAFLRWLNQSGMFPAGLEARLPSEAEWEYACRAGTETEYWNGDGEAALREVGWYGGNSENRTHPAGEKEKPNPWGLHDMHGNVWEWCEDAWDAKAYAKRPHDWSAAAWKAGDSPGRVVRGGSWLYTAWGCRSAFRNWWHPRGRFRFQGFRVLLVLPAPVAEPKEPAKQGGGREGAGGRTEAERRWPAEGCPQGERSEANDRPGDRKAEAEMESLDLLLKPKTKPA